MGLYVNTEKKIIYIALSKNASNWMTKILTTYYGFAPFIPQEIMDLTNSDSNGSNYIREILTHGLQKFNLHDGSYDDFTFLVVVRDPYTRFVSGFLHNKGFFYLHIMDDKIMKDEYINMDLTTLNTSIHSKWTGGTTPVQLGFLEENSLDEVIENKDSYLSDDLTLNHYGHSFYQQSPHINSIVVPNIILYKLKFENLESELNDFLTGAGFDIVHSDIPAIHITYQLYNTHNYYTETSLQFINTHFSDDFTRFGYTKFSTMEEMAAYYN
jgi:hypothetical protein